MCLVEVVVFQLEGLFDNITIEGIVLRDLGEMTSLEMRRAVTECLTWYEAMERE